MPCGIGFIQWLSDGGYLPTAGRVLDLGGSRLLGATPDELRALLIKHGTSLAGPALDAACAEMSSRSSSHELLLPLSDVFGSTRVTYHPLDTYQVRPGIRFDPNASRLPLDWRNSYDLVLNFGTSAGVWNQHNVFENLHDGCRPGGVIFHQVPGTGHLGYAFYCYQPVLFEELAKENGYELAELWYSGPLASQSVLSLADRYPGVGDPDRLCNDVEGFRAHPVPDAVLNVLLRKVSDAPFRLPRPGYSAVPELPSRAYRAARRVYRKLVGPKKPA